MVEFRLKISSDINSMSLGICVTKMYHFRPNSKHFQQRNVVGWGGGGGVISKNRKDEKHKARALNAVRFLTACSTMKTFCCSGKRCQN